MFDKLFYIFHCSVKNGFAQAERASFMLSTSIFLYASSLYFFFLVLAEANSPHPWIMPGVLLCLGIVNGLLTSKYFVGTGRYRRIIDRYGSPREINKRTRFFFRFISIGLFFLGSFAAFIAAGIMLSKYLHPW